MNNGIEARRVFREILIEVASEPGRDGQIGSTTTYLGLCAEAQRRGLPDGFPMLRPPFRGVGEVLGEISAAEDGLGRPLLSAIVVQEGTGRPGPGFAGLARRLDHEVGSDEGAYVESEQREVWRFWQSTDPAKFNDAAFGKVLNLLRQIRRDLRRAT